MGYFTDLIKRWFKRDKTRKERSAIKHTTVTPLYGGSTGQTDSYDPMSLTSPLNPANALSPLWSEPSATCSDNSHDFSSHCHDSGGYDSGGYDSGTCDTSSYGCD